MTKTLGQHIVADPAICHGKPTFVGTRILVADVLEQVANGMAWEVIVEDWRGDISKEAIAESVRLAREALLTQEYAPGDGAHEIAERQLLGQHTVTLTAEDSRVFAEAIVNPAPANDKLRMAMGRHRRVVGR